VKIVTLWAALLAVAFPVTSLGQGLSDLDKVQDYVSGRISSTDPAGHNGDARAVEPGQTLKLGEVRGAGEFTHLWFTIAARDADHLRELVLRITWDDASRPAVECPMGDFFAQGPGKYVEFTSVPVSVGSQMALNCYWPMPFNKHAVVTVTNEGAGRVDALYFNLDYRTFPHGRKGPVRYFHTQYRNYFPSPKGVPLTLCDTEGAGHYVGTIVTVLANSDGWWGEGNDEWFVDGAKKPVITGTGSEDYFCGAWDFGKAFWTPYFGVTYYDNADFGGEKRGIQNTVYRWHVMDPVPFAKSLKMTLEHGSQGGNEDRTPYRNSYTTVSLFYVNHPQGDGPALAPYAQRVPHLLSS
jgi:hypothetical protein